MLRDGDWLWVAIPSDLVRLDLDTLECTRFVGTGIPLGSQGERHFQSLLLGPEGRVWVSSSGDLYRYDEQTWQSFATEPYVSKIAFDAEGNLWTRTTASRATVFARYPGHEPSTGDIWEGEILWGQRPGSTESDCDDWIASDFPHHAFNFHSSQECRLLSDWYGRLDSLPLPEGVTSWHGRSPIAADSSERLWMLAPQPAPASTPYALWSFDGTSWQALSWPYGLSSLLIADEARGGVWVGTDEGLVFSDGQSLKRYLLSPDDAIPIGPSVWGFHTDANGRLWADAAMGALLYDDTDAKHPIDWWQRVQVDEGYTAGSVLAADDRGGLWSSSHKAVSYFDGETWTHYPPFSGNRCNPHLGLADGKGGLWVSSITCPMEHFDGKAWTQYDTGTRRESLALGHGGEIYAMGQDGDLRQFNGKTWETLLPASSYGSPPDRDPWVIDLVVGPEGNVWAALADTSDLLVYWDGGWELIHIPAEGTVMSLLFDSLDRLWVGHDYGVLRYDGRSWESIVSKNYPIIVWDLAEDRHGRIWLSTRDEGFHYYDPTRE